MSTFEGRSLVDSVRSSLKINNCYIGNITRENELGRSGMDTFRLVFLQCNSRSLLTTISYYKEITYVEF